MPELPEVEVVTQGLNKVLELPEVIEEVQFLRKDLRSPLPLKMQTKLIGQRLLGAYRRAKYILLETDDYCIISHLGMTGSWRLDENFSKANHDHVVMRLASGKQLVFSDPRRFGVFDVVPKGEVREDKRFTHLGPEPFDKKHFNFEYLFQLSRKKTAPLKNFIMDQRVVVGVGNIYAAEALFLSGLSPLVRAERLTKEQAKTLVAAIQKVLKAAIRGGGTTISDFKQAEGGSGYFQHKLFVYDRAGEACRKCGTLIKIKVLAGRSTFWCVKCQR